MSHRKPCIPAALAIFMSLLLLPVSVQSQSPTDNKRQLVLPVEGKCWVTAPPDYAQAQDSVIPVFIRTTIMSPEGTYRDRASIKAVVVQNRSGKAAVSIRLRWFATASSDGLRENIYGKGVLDAQNVYIGEGEKAELNITMPQMNVMLKRWFADHPQDAGVVITLGVSEVVFDDGTTWKAVPIG